MHCNEMSVSGEGTRKELRRGGKRREERRGEDEEKRSKRTRMVGTWKRGDNEIQWHKMKTEDGQTRCRESRRDTDRSRGHHQVLTRTLVDFVKRALAFGKTSFLIVWSSRYFFIILKTLRAASFKRNQNITKWHPKLIPLTWHFVHWKLTLRLRL